MDLIRTTLQRNPELACHRAGQELEDRQRTFPFPSLHSSQTLKVFLQMSILPSWKSNRIVGGWWRFDGSGFECRRIVGSCTFLPLFISDDLEKGFRDVWEVSVRLAEDLRAS